jgi:hypothetical protein
MGEFINQQNLLLLRKQLAETPHSALRLQVSKLLAEEEAKNCAPLKEKHAVSLYGRRRRASPALCVPAGSLFEASSLRSRARLLADRRLGSEN